MFLFLFFIPYSCSSQKKEQEKPLKNRLPAVAGQFYPAEKQAIKSSLKKYFSQAEPKSIENTMAIISPHAGYVFSGTVAASAFNQINGSKEYENIFVLASSHKVAFDGASIYNKGHYETPLGEVKVNLELSNKLIDEHKCFSYYERAHTAEHSLEVQLPFLQYKMKKDFTIVPIVIGTQSESKVKQIAKALKPFFNEKNLFIISSDFSHYPKASDAENNDERTAEAIVSNNPGELMKRLKYNEMRSIKNLATSLCGWTSVLTLLHMSSDTPGIEAKKIQYMHSGEYSKDKSRVVGYWAIAFFKNNSKTSNNMGFELNKQDKKDLLHIARKTIEELINNNNKAKFKGKDYSKTLNEKCGAFVTLHKRGQLRGCIGRFMPDEPLYEVVRQMAIAASTQDHRFDKVKPHELDDIDIEISVLTPLKEIDSIDEIEIGTHGIYIKSNGRSGTLLPQVATDNNWDKEQFLGYCSQYKAGLGWDGWKDAEVFTYKAIIFDEKEFE